ncbi:hypothetical protein quinque_006527 [Culex quinquefasciatus]
MSSVEVTAAAKPADAPEHCPGTASESAGKASACAGCPNQQICATGPKGPDPSIALVKEKLREVRNKVLVLSGKGGVGKSTVTALLSRAMAQHNPDRNFGVLDIDICGPSQPRVLGVLGEQVHQSGSGWSPVPDDAIIWRGPKKNGMIRQFLTEVDWGQLDYLVLDTPPGTSDEHLSAATFLKETDGRWGAVLVTTPQEVALLDVRKEITFCKKMAIPVVGVVENMSVFVCPKCATESDIFPAKTGGAERMCADMEVRYLGKLPLDPRLAKCCDEGKDFLAEHAGSPTVTALKGIVARVQEFFETE